MIILRTPRRSRSSTWEATLARQIGEAGLPAPVREWAFHPGRRWRFDFVWLAQGLAVEFEGAVFAQGRHTRGAGFCADTEKYNAAVLLGWRVLRFTERQVKNHTAVEMIGRALQSGGVRPLFAREDS